MKRLLAAMFLAAVVAGVGGAPPALAWTTEGGDLGGWQGRTLTLHFNPTGCTVSAATLTSTIDQAIGIWNSAPVASVTLARDPNPSSTPATTLLNGGATDSPLIVCDTSFGTDLGVDADFVPGATRIKGSASNINYGGTFLNSQAAAGAAIDQLTTDQLAVALTHEIGHILGLGHSGQLEALMYYSIANKTKPILTRDDLDGLAYLYPRNELAAGAFGCAAVHGVPAEPFLAWLPLIVGVPWLVRLLLRRKRLRP